MRGFDGLARPGLVWAEEVSVALKSAVMLLEKCLKLAGLVWFGLVRFGLS